MTDEFFNHLLKCLGFFILVSGMTGNALSLVVLCRKPLRTIKIGPYLIALCIADISALLTGIVFNMLYLYDSELQHKSLALCKITFFMLCFATQCPSWLTVIITFERMLCIWRPIASLQRTINPLAVIFTMAILLAALDVGFTTVFVIADGVCTLVVDQLMWFIAVTYSYIPSVMLIACNSVIIYKMCNRPTLGQTARSRPATGNTIRVVLAINIVFLVTTLPIVFTPLAGKRLLKSHIILTDFISSINNSINFVLYVCFNRVFRRELRSLFRARQPPQIYTLPDHEHL